MELFLILNCLHLSALLGTILCFVIMFLVNYKYAVLSVGMFLGKLLTLSCKFCLFMCINYHCLSMYSVAVMVILFVVISLRTPPTPWGDVSQALIYHQVSHLIQN